MQKTGSLFFLFILLLFFVIAPIYAQDAGEGADVTGPQPPHITVPEPDVSGAAPQPLAKTPLVEPAAIAANGTYTIGANFTGSSRSQSGFIPPDTMGAVGEDHIVELINGRYAVYDKTGVQLQASSLDAFWISAGVTPDGSFSFDPRVVYDRHTGRWFAVAVDNAGNANNFLVAVSAGSDPTTGWTGFKIDSDTDNVEWADFPTLGLNQDVVVIHANMFPVVSGSSSVTLLVLPKSDLLAASPTVANGTLFENVNPNNTGFTPQPAFDQDNGMLPLPLFSVYNKPAGFLKTSSIGGTAFAPTLNTSGGFLSVTARNAPPDIDQPGTKVDIDAGSNRFSGNVIVQQIPGRTNPSLWGVQGVEVGGRAAIEWYEVDAVTNVMLQSGVISDTSLAFNYPSIAVNDFGDVVIGFSGGDPSTFISTYAVVGQTSGGTTTFSALQMLKAGVSDYQRLDSIGRNRWGDYSATVVDPANEYRFWTFQEFVSATDEWSVQMTELIIVTPPVTPTVTITQVNASDARLDWTSDIKNCGYQVYRDTQPYLAAGSAISPLLDYTVEQFDLVGDVADLVDYFYRVEAVGCGGETAVSNEVAIFHFAIEPGT